MVLLGRILEYFVSQKVLEKIIELNSDLKVIDIPEFFKDFINNEEMVVYDIPYKLILLENEDPKKYCNALNYFKNTKIKTGF